MRIIRLNNELMVAEDNQPVLSCQSNLLTELIAAENNYPFHALL